MACEAPDRAAGFTLLEVLVAFIIAALALGVLFEGGIGGLNTARVAARYGEALSRAESHLALAGAGPDYQPQDRQGDEGAGFHWRLRIQPVAVGAAVEAGKPLPALYGITVVESWAEGAQSRAVTLRTARAGTSPPPTP